DRRVESELGAFRPCVAQLRLCQRTHSRVRGPRLSGLDRQRVAYPQLLKETVDMPIRLPSASAFAKTTRSLMSWLGVFLALAAHAQTAEISATVSNEKGNPVPD